MTMRSPSTTHSTAALAMALATFALSTSAAPLTTTILDPAGKPVADAVVYAVPAAATRVPAKAPQVVSINQQDREFVPYVTVIQTGTTVNFPNRDPLLHHVYSFSPVKSFEIKLYSGDAPRGILFDKPGVVTLGCNIHDWMIGYILVVDTPYFARTDAGGQARISDIAAGEYDIRVWHPGERAEAAQKPIKVDGRTAQEMQFIMDVAPRKKRFKPPLDTVRYK